VLRRSLDPAAALRALSSGAAFPTVYLYGPRGRLRLRIRGDDRDTIPTLLAALQNLPKSRPHESFWPTLAGLWRASHALSSAPNSAPPSGRPTLIETYAGWNPACRRLQHGLLRLAARFPQHTRPRIVTLTIPLPALPTRGTPP
jgi:hypothetical protein